MATLQELGNRQINQVIRSAVERQVPATATLRSNGGWLNLHSRFLAIRGEHLLIALPAAEGDTGPRVFAPADKINLSFKLKHHKHLFTATVVATEFFADGGQDGMQVLCICWPTRMQRLQRRVFLRVAVPPNRIVRCSFWLGGCEAEPAGTSPDRPVWSGRVTNLSAGGFQMVTTPDPLELLDVGDTVGVRLVFGAGHSAVFADAQFRHGDIQDGHGVLGFQFLGLAQSEGGRQALDVLAAKVSEFQRMEEHAASRRGG